MTTATITREGTTGTPSRGRPVGIFSRRAGGRLGITMSPDPAASASVPTAAPAALEAPRAARRARLLAARRRRLRRLEAANRRVRLARGDVVQDARRA